MNAYSRANRRIYAALSDPLSATHRHRLDDLLKRADLAMYAAKSEGRRTFRLFAPEYDAKARQRRQLPAPQPP